MGSAEILCTSSICAISRILNENVLAILTINTYLCYLGKAVWIMSEVIRMHRNDSWSVFGQFHIVKWVSVKLVFIKAYLELSFLRFAQRL